MDTPFSRAFGLRLPLVVAPMGGGPTTPALVAATCGAGALGSLAGAYLAPEQITAAVEAVRARTSRPFAINLFTPMPALSLRPAQVAAAAAALRPFRDELGLPEPRLAPPFHADVDAQIEAVLRARPAAFSFVFGLLAREPLEALRARGIYTIGTATRVEEGLALAESGVDAIVAQGREAGAHRGVFDAEAPDPDVGTLALTRALVARTVLPVIAAGGIMDGRGIAEVLAAGASAAMMGTAFLVCDEAGTSRPYREALLAPGPKPTRLTRAFSGRLARGLVNRFTTAIDPRPDAILPFPAQNAFTRDIRTEAARRGDAGLLSLWAGTRVDALRPPMPAAELVERLRDELLHA